jgi:Cdc6-like AAA superfamily ATPase
MDEERKRDLRIQVGMGFKPGKPVDKLDLFSGRKAQLNTVIDVVVQSGRHVILFGEPGVGKTSLAVVLAEILSNAGVQVLSSGTINCDRTDDFDSLWRKIFRELTLVMRARKASFRSDAFDERRSLNSMLPTEELITPDDIRYILSQIVGTVVVIIDELDKLPDKASTELLADTVKNLSDHNVEATLILVGVADNIGELIRGHGSVERVMVQVRMQRMSKPELTDIIDKGLRYSGMTIDEDAKDRITHLSHGLPHFTHLLGLASAIHAVEDDRMHIDVVDVAAATHEAVNQSHSLLSAYNDATSSPQKQNIYADVLLACALVRPDPLGYFYASDVANPLSILKEKQYKIPSFARHLSQFCSEKRGAILQKTGEKRNIRYRFANPLMQPFVLIHGLANDLLPFELLWMVTR